MKKQLAVIFATLMSLTCLTACDIVNDTKDFFVNGYNKVEDWVSGLLGKEEKPKVEGLTFDIAASENVEIGDAYWVSEKKAVDADGKLYKPEIKVYREGQDITDSDLKMGVFFAIDSFADYRVEYTVEVGGEKKIFATDITVVDTTAPTIETKNLPETLDFGSTFVLDESIIEVTDNSRETVTADFVVTQINGSREIVLQANDAGEYTLQEGYVESLVVSVSATDSHNNTVQEAFTIKNTEGVPVALTKKGNWNTFWSSVADVDYYYAQETVNGTESDVLTVNANVSSIPNAKALAFVVKLDTELKNLPGTLEFDIYTENMCNWFSVMPYNGAQNGTEVGFKDYGNDAWYHCKVELVNTIPALDSVILHIQPTTTQWWGEKLNVYDSSKITTFKLANFKYEEKAPILPPDVIPEDTVLDCNSEYAMNSVIAKDMNNVINGVQTLAWTDEVAYGDEQGSLKITAIKADAGYLVLSAPLLTDVSEYDYLEFHVYNPGTQSMRVSPAWTTAFTINPGEWGTVKVSVSELISGSLVNPWTSAKISATDITGLSFYVREIEIGNCVYMSSIKGVKEVSPPEQPDVDEPEVEDPTVEVAANVIVDTNSADVLNVVKTMNGQGSHTLAYSEDVKMNDEKGSLQIICTTTGDGYIIVFDPLLKDISQYDYFEFQITNPTEHVVYMAVAWIVGVNINPGETATLRISAEDFASNAIVNPEGKVMSSTDITNIMFYIKNMESGESIYVSSFKCVKANAETAEN